MSTKSNTQTAPKPTSLTARLDAAGVNIFAVPDELAEHYAATTDEQAYGNLVARGESAEARAAFETRRVIVALLSAELGFSILGSADFGSYESLFSARAIGSGGVGAGVDAVRDDARALATQAVAADIGRKLVWHGERLRIARENLDADIAIAEREARFRAENTDAITGRFSIGNGGASKRVSVIPGVHADQYGSSVWSVTASPLVQHLIGFEVARQLLDADPELAAIVGGEASALLAANGLITDRP